MVAAFSPDGARAVTASVNKTARVWDARSGKPLTEPRAHQGHVMVATFSPDGGASTAGARRQGGQVRCFACLGAGIERDHAAIRVGAANGLHEV